MFSAIIDLILRRKNQEIFSSIHFNLNTIITNISLIVKERSKFQSQFDTPIELKFSNWINYPPPQIK
ncbi:MAG: hypothetical protein ACI8XB_001878 [Patiriisocius sp.]|jgi:hypothetical protein